MTKTAKKQISASLKITGGELRGRTIKAPSTSVTHPMGSREKMALFNALASLKGPLEGVQNVLDVCCGSGALGLEALSRGAGHAVFVDNNVSVLQTVKDNISVLGISDRTEIVKSDVSKIASTSITWQKYDLILVDPPYDNFPSDLTVLADLLSEDGVLVLSHPSITSPNAVFPNLALLSTKSHASANLSFYKK
jgi:16S rRNA (guanine966-N2)-methyltransferase